MITNNLEQLEKKNIKIGLNFYKKKQYYKNKYENNHEYIMSYSNYILNNNKKILIASLRNKTKDTFNHEYSVLFNINDINMLKSKIILKNNNISHNLSIFQLKNFYIGFGEVYHTIEKIKVISLFPKISIIFNFFQKFIF